jgi:predicted component of type VI protein secretion system
MKISVSLKDGHKIEKDFQKSLIVIGRSKKCDLQINDEVLSRRHCQIEDVDGAFYITDLGSTNGIHLDGKRLPQNTRVLFETFLHLQVGPFDCTVQPSDSSSIANDSILNSNVKLQSNGSKSYSKADRKAPMRESLTKNKSRTNDFKTKFGIYLSLFILICLFFFFVFDKNSPEPEVVDPSSQELAPPSKIKDITIL